MFEMGGCHSKIKFLHYLKFINTFQSLPILLPIYQGRLLTAHVVHPQINQFLVITCYQIRSTKLGRYVCDLPLRTHDLVEWLLNSSMDLILMNLIEFQMSYFLYQEWNFYCHCCDVMGRSFLKYVNTEHTKQIVAVVYFSMPIYTICIGI